MLYFERRSELFKIIAQPIVRVTEEDNTEMQVHRCCQISVRIGTLFIDRTNISEEPTEKERRGSPQK